MVNFQRAQVQLLLHEGLVLKPYLDTLGNWTVGVGWNITGRGGMLGLSQALGRKLTGKLENVRLTREEALRLLEADIRHVDAMIPTFFPEYLQLDEVRQRVCLDMAFNMGMKALSFKNTIGCIKARDWSAAVRHLWASRWAGQVGDGPGNKFDRADRLTKMLLTGDDFTV